MEVGAIYPAYCTALGRTLLRAGARGELLVSFQ